jgi:hypothetical protein
MRTSAAAAALALAAVVVTGAAQAQSLAVQLDTDASLEHVERVVADCPAEDFGAPGGCSFIRVIDGDARVAITPLSQRPRNPYGWAAGPPRLRDLTGDGRPEIVWELDTAGGTGSSPRRVGVHRWTGHRAVKLFSTSGLTRDSQPIRLDVLAPRRGLRELRLVELVYRPQDATCCPGFRRTTRYRFDGRRMARVPGSTRLTRLRP